MDEGMKKERAIAKGKFTRKMNVLKEGHAQEYPIEVLRENYKEVCQACEIVELVNEKIINSLDSGDKAYDKIMEECDNYMLELDKEKNYAHALTIKGNKNDSINNNEGVKLKVQPLCAPHFSGRVRDYPTFRKDYERLMKAIYHDDPYALRQCLSGEALETVKGVDDNFISMFKRLDERFGNPSKITESVLSDIKNLRSVSEGNSKKFIDMVDVVERAYLDLNKFDLSAEINTVTMVSYIENLLPITQKREWVKLALDVTDKSKLFKTLLQYLLKEKSAMEYMEADVRRSSSSSKGQIHNIVGKDCETDPLVAAMVKLQGNQEKLSECLVNLTQKMSDMMENNVHSSGYQHKHWGKCWFHDTNSHDISECTGFRNLPSGEKYDVLRKKGACFMCLKIGHTSKYCELKGSCEECGKKHHRMLHEMFLRNLTPVSSNMLYRDGVLLMISTVYSKRVPVTTLWDSGSNMTLVTHRMAKRLGLRGSSINLSVTKIGNECHKFETCEYKVPVTDSNGRIWELRACGINEITSETGQINSSGIAALLGVDEQEIRRPHGKIELLVGSDYCGILPVVVKTVGNIQLMKNIFGYCLRGSHPLLKLGLDGKAHTLRVRINHVTGLSRVNDLLVEPKASVTKRLDDFFNVENLGTECNPNCGGCKCGNCPLGNKKFSIKEERELALISQGLTHDSTKYRWAATYPWLKPPNELSNNVSVTLTRLKSTEKRLDRLGREYATAYNDQIRDMVNRGVARKLTLKEMHNYKGPTHYISPHEILKPESKSTPVRIVFNSSASYMGPVLNEYYAKGPDVLNNLILLRFRQMPIAIAGDISKMYNSVLISELDQHTHRVLWRDMDTRRDADHYVLQTVTFGDRPSGIMSILALHKTAEMLKMEHPIAAEMIIKDSYVDDVLHSCQSVIEAVSRIKSTEEILRVGGFEMKQWIISGNPIVDEDIKIIDIDIEKVLGMVGNQRRICLHSKLK